MIPTDARNDPVLAALRELRPCDVSAARAARLRSRCHRAFEVQRSSSHAPRCHDSGGWGRAVRVFAAAWCIVYVLETIRQAAAVYGL